MAKKLIDLQQALAARDSVVAQLITEANQLSATKQTLDAAYDQAITEENKTKAAEILKQIKAVEIELQVTADMADRAAAKRICTDAEAIEAANTETASASAEIRKLLTKYEKAEHDLADLMYNMIHILGKAADVRRACLEFHSGAKSSATDFVLLSRLSSEGLNPLPKLPDFNVIDGVMRKYYPSETDLLRSIVYAQ